MKKEPYKYDPYDYHTFSSKDMGAKARARLGIGEIWMNTIKCKECGDVITSNNRHDFKYCKCKTVFVDGGSQYARRGGKIDAIEDMTELFDEAEKKKELLKKLRHLQFTSDNEAAHCDADDLLLKFIDDEEISEAFDNIPKWYA